MKNNVFSYLKLPATIQNCFTEKVSVMDTTTLQTSSNDKSNIIELTGENFDEELRNRALLVMFHKPK